MISSLHVLTAFYSLRTINLMPFTYILIYLLRSPRGPSQATISLIISTNSSGKHMRVSWPSYLPNQPPPYTAKHIFLTICVSLLLYRTVSVSFQLSAQRTFLLYQKQYKSNVVLTKRSEQVGKIYFMRSFLLFSRLSGTHLFYFNLYYCEIIRFHYVSRFLNAGRTFVSGKSSPHTAAILSTSARNVI